MQPSPALKRFLRRHFVHGRLQFAAGPTHAAVVGLELALQRVVDSFQALPETGNRELVGQLTAVVKTFERPQALRRLVASIRRRYPELRVIVVDDSRQPVELPGIEMVILPYDSGVSAGRREGLRRVRTKYMLNLDDDFVFYRQTKLPGALAIMERHPEIDVMGGEVVNLPFFHRADYGRAGVYAAGAAPTMPAGSRIGGLAVYDKVANFFVARTERVRLVDWDPALKRMEHADFFSRARGVLTSVFNPDLKCLHAGTPFDRAYMEKRLDVAGDAAVLRMRYGEARRADDRRLTADDSR
jgi:glycosyltransferase involved in cell wall biosynthesis